MHTHPKRFKLALEFDGGRYSGWQKQDDARSIQGSLLAAAAELFQGEIDVQGSGRTDGGVHAIRYVAHLEARTSQSPKEIGAQLNALLPKDIAIVECKRAGARFHARHNCIGRSYLYQIAGRKRALGRDYVWQIPEVLHPGRMQEAASTLVGMHDFTSFTDRQALKRKSPLVLVHQARIAEAGDLILLRIVGSHFLWKMVRRIAGVLAEAGKGRLTVAEVRGFLESPVVLKQYTAPSQGLFFERAFYDQEELDGFLAAEALVPAFF